MNEIAVSSEEMEVGGKDIRNALLQIVDVSKGISSASKSILHRTKDVTIALEETANLTIENNTGTMETKLGVEDISKSAGYLRDQALKTKEQSVILEEELAFFKITQ